MHGLYNCERCSKDLDCGDDCEGWTGWADVLPPLGDDYWPVCPCCGAVAQLVRPLVAIPG
jgi:hypothetical protein